MSSIPVVTAQRLPDAGRRARSAALVGSAALSAALLALCFPPVDLAPIAWFATVPWMVALAWNAADAGGSDDGPSRRAGLRAVVVSGALHSAVLHVITCWWMVGLMRGQGGLSLPVALLTYGIGAITVMPFSVLPALTVSALFRRIGAWAFLVMAPAWILVDIARARMVLGFPWYLQGMTQARSPIVLGVADLGAVHAVSAVVLLGNALIASLLWLMVRRRDRSGPPGARRLASEPAMRAALCAGALVLAALAHGALASRRHAPASVGARRIVLPPPEGAGSPGYEARPAVDGELELAAAWRDGGSIHVGLVQGAVPQEVVLEARPEEDDARARLQLRLSELALLSGARVLAWSESSYPGTFSTAWPMRRLQESLAASSDEGEGTAEAIVGGLADVWPAPGAPRTDYTVTNSAVLVDASGPKGRYDKRYLVPFGEYLPAKWFFFWFKQLTRTVSELRAGSSDAPLQGDSAAYGAFICYEAVLPQHVRAISVAGAEVLVNLTNDGWFHGSAVPEQHMRFTIVRAVENRKWLMRCANSGISVVISPDGRVVSRLEEGERGVLLSSVEPRSNTTPYMMLGDVPLTLLGLLAAFATAVALIADRIQGARPLPRAPVDG